MDINPETAVRALLKQGVMLKAAPDTLFKTDKNHCVIVLNKQPAEDEYIIFVSASSQYLKRMEYAAKMGLPPNSIVMIHPKAYHHLPKYTAIDCNYIHTLTKGELTRLYNEKRLTFYKETPQLSKDHLGKVIKGVKESPLVQQEVINLL